MDKKIIQQYGEDILCYNLRTARQKKRMQYKDFEKQLIQLRKEERKLYQQKRDLGYEPLIPPVQKGWKRFFVLRDDVARSTQADFFQNILNKINSYDWSHRKNFLIRTRMFGRKKYSVKRQKLLEPWLEKFLELDFTEHEKRYFDEEWKFDGYRCFEKIFVFNEPWRFVLRTRPNMITKTKRVDSALDARLDEIDNYLRRNDLRPKLSKLLGVSYKWRCAKEFEKHNEVNLFKNKSFHQILDLIKE